MLSIFFDLDGEYLWASIFDGSSKLIRISLKNLSSEHIPIPELPEDAISYLAQNPANLKEWAFATFQKDVYLLKENGEWQRILNQGRP